MASDQAKLRDKLLNDKKRLEQELSEQKQGAPGTGEKREENPFGNREEEAAEAAEMENRLALRKRLEDHIRDVDKTLEKVSKGTYGKCDDCGQPIGPERLEALPTANLCMKCKAATDKRGTRR
ncbi:MAG: TraR/DksA C4-type zinc finger protein [Dehalococcoidia bacterium]|nr:TraR/DksA C4-type zinc finger protein [Dehalococcoidia bacterium]